MELCSFFFLKSIRGGLYFLNMNFQVLYSSYPEPDILIFMSNSEMIYLIYITLNDDKDQFKL
jgi:hypothetical protein